MRIAVASEKDIVVLPRASASPETKLMAKLLYLFSNRTEEEPRLWGVSEIVSMERFDFRDGRNGIENLMKCELAPTLFKSVPDLVKDFKEGVFSKSHVKSKTQTCLKLKKLSLDSF